MFNLIPYRNHENNLFRMFDEFEKNFWGNNISDFNQFRTDIVDKGDHYELRADLPGFNKEDIRIDVEHDTLTISARHEEQHEETRDNYVRRERRCGAFSRSFDASGIHTDNIGASYQNGVLTLTMPKKNPEQLPPSRRIEIQ